jgi:hypothetical protein
MAKVHTTQNKTMVFDPEVDTANVVVVYRGLGPEYKKSYSYDTAAWLLGEARSGVGKDLESKIIFVVPDDYNQDCATCIDQATKVIKTKINRYSLCGFSKGGSQVYKNLRLKVWKILGLIDSVSPTMVKKTSDGERYKDDIIDDYVSQIRCVYGVSHWGAPPPKGRKPEHYTDNDWSFVKTKNFHDHLEEIKAEMTDDDKDDHSDMPRVFFKTYGSAFV